VLVSFQDATSGGSVDSLYVSLNATGLAAPPSGAAGRFATPVRAALTRVGSQYSIPPLPTNPTAGVGPFGINATPRVPLDGTLTLPDHLFTTAGDYTVTVTLFAVQPNLTDRDPDDLPVTLTFHVAAQPQLLAGPPAAAAPDMPSVTDTQLQPVVTAAVGQLAAAGFDVTGLAGVTYQITALPPAVLGLTSQTTVWIDQNAQGHGWYLDASAASAGAFTQAAPGQDWLAPPTSPAFGRVDLLTVVTHELGHVLGLPDLDPAVSGGDLMTATLGLGVRRVPGPADLQLLTSRGTAYQGLPDLSTGATAAGPGTAPSPVGSYPITAALGTLRAANYTFRFVSGTLTITQATPHVTVSDPGGIYTGAPFPASAAVAGVVEGRDDVPGPALEGVGLTLTYYAGTSADGTPLTGAPSAPGTYTVVARFPGSTDYKAASASVIFTISPSTQGAPTAVINGADFGGDASGVRGQLRSFFLSATDSSGAALTSATFTVNWGDGHSQSFTGLGARTPVSHTWAATGTYTISVTAIAGGMSSKAATQAIAVKVVDYQLVQTDSVPGATAWALVVGGSTHNNEIEIEKDVGTGLLDVEIENRATECYEFHQAFADHVHGAPVGRLIVYGQASDEITVARCITIDAELHASDAGNSILKAGGGDDILIGGAGDDILIGGRATTSSSAGGAATCSSAAWATTGSSAVRVTTS
jgi:hypothetical protein